MSSNGLPPNPSRVAEHSPPPPPRRIEEDRERFSRSNFAPIPNRHEDIVGDDTGPGYNGNGAGGHKAGTDRYIPSSSPPPPRREPLPLRERDIAQGIPQPRRGEVYDADISRWERRLDRESNGREDWDERGRRGPYWEEEFGEFSSEMGIVWVADLRYSWM